MAPVLAVAVVFGTGFGIGANVLLHRVLKRNLIAFLLSLVLGLPAVGESIRIIGNGMITGNAGFAGVGQAFGVALGMIAGIVCYFVATLGTSVYRWRKKRIKT